MNRPEFCCQEWLIAALYCLTNTNSTVHDNIKFCLYMGQPRVAQWRCCTVSRVNITSTHIWIENTFKALLFHAAVAVITLYIVGILLLRFSCFCHSQVSSWKYLHAIYGAMTQIVCQRVTVIGSKLRKFV